jgi:Zn-dependent protease
MDWLLNGSFRIGRFSGINVHVHITFVIWIAYRLFTAHSGDFGEAAFFTGMLFAIVLVHEFGHCFGARMVGGDAENILMWPLGGLAFAHAPMTPWAQFVTVACGPLVNVVFCVASAAVLIVATGSLHAISLNPFAGPGPLYEMWQLYVWYFYWINLMLLCFNLLPIFPMDGGQLFRVMIWPMVGLGRATVISAQLGIIGGIGLGLWGIKTNNFVMVAIAVNGVFVSYQHLNAARHGMVQEEFRSYRSAGRFERRRGWWSRMIEGFKRRNSKSRPEAAVRENPNPGGWQKKLDEEARLEAEVDRILAKVKEQGMNSLSYVERQTLENATRRKRQQEQAYDREIRM